MLKARGGNPSEKLFLKSEKQLFLSVYTLLIENRAMIFQDDHIQPLASTIETPPSPQQSESNEKEEIKKIESDHTVIKILENIPTFIGTDSKQYDLKQRDIISLPNDLASMLIKKKVAELVSMDA